MATETTKLTEEDLYRLKLRSVMIKTHKLAWKSRDKINTFIEYVGIDDFGLPMVQADLQYELQEHLTNNQFAQTMLPRGHTKSVGGVLYRSSWEAGRNCNIFQKIVRQNEKMAGRRLKSIQKIVESKRFKRVFPDLLPDKDSGWSSKSLYFQRDVISDNPSFEACSILGTGTGGRAHKIYVDDPCDIKNSVLQPKLRQSAITNFYGNWSNLGLKGATIWFFNTPYHEKDLGEDIRKNKIYKTLRRPIENFKPIWEEEWPEERLRAKCDEIGELEFARGYCLETISDEDMIIKPHWIEYWNEITVPTVCYIAIDPNCFTEKKKSDYIGIVVGAKANNGNLYVIEAIREKLSFPAFIKLIKKLYRKHSPKVVGIEDVAAQNIIIQQIARESSIPVVGVNPEGKGKAQRLRLNAIHFSNSKIFLKGDPIENQVHKSQQHLFDELVGFPYAEYKDLVDAINYCWKISEEFKFTARTMTHGPNRAQRKSDKVNMFK